jgi:hypothetical protein
MARGKLDLAMASSYNQLSAFLSQENGVPMS